MQWCLEPLSLGREVDVSVLGPRPYAPRWAVKGLRSVDDLRIAADALRSAARLAELAIEKTVV